MERAGIRGFATQSGYFLDAGSVDEEEVAKLLFAHEVEQAGAHGQRQKIVDHIKNDKFANASPDFGFIGGANMEEQAIEHFARVIAGEDAIKSAGDRRDGDVNNVRMRQDCFQRELQEHSNFFGRQSSLAAPCAGRGPLGGKQVQGTEAKPLRRRFKPWIGP